jgi:RNA polymerase subunit RPABC4/transcription elongation factor Spt4
MSLAPVPSESAACANCSAPLVADQRYCLSCGQPCSPVRLAFLDVLQSEGSQVAQRSLACTPAVAYAPLLEPAGPSGWLGRYSPLFGALTVLLLAMIAGLLVGHWVTQNKAAVPNAQTIKIEGLSAPVAAAITTPSTTATTPAVSTAGQPSAKEEAEEVATEAKAEKAQAVKVEKTKPKKVSNNTLQKLNSTTGKKHAEELNKLGAEPIETGG